MLFSIQIEYRLIDMNSMVNLNRIDIAVCWKSSHGDLIPFHLNPGCSASIKSLCRSRGYGERKMENENQIDRNMNEMCLI